MSDERSAAGNNRHSMIAIALLVLIWTASSYTYAAKVELSLTSETVLSPDVFRIPGRLEGEGTHFQIGDSKYLNLTLDVSQRIKLVIESVPEMVVMQIESASKPTYATITLSGFPLEMIFHKYEDDYHNHVIFTTDASGKYSYVQDLSAFHLVFVQPRASTVFLGDNGWNSSKIGIWDPVTRTGTLTQDVTGTIQIDANNITLNGNGHTTTGTHTGSGVYIFQKTGVTIKNLKIAKFSSGAAVYSSSRCLLTGNTATSNDYNGILVYRSGSSILTNNVLTSNNDYGVYISHSGGSIFTGNTVSNSQYGVWADFSEGSTIMGNTVSNSQYGIVLYHSGRGVLIGNTAASNNQCGIWLYYSGSSSVASNSVSYSRCGIDLDSSRDSILSSNTVAYSQDGIHLDSSGGCILSSNTVTGSNHFGCFLIGSDNNSLTGNSVSNGQIGIRLESSRWSILSGNTVSNNQEGIQLYSNGSTLTENTVSNNRMGIILSGSSYNVIYNNNFINNSQQIRIFSGSGNVFNLGKPTGGNYWSNWSYPDKDGDGVVDSPYVFAGGQDYLPWATMNGWRAH